VSGGKIQNARSGTHEIDPGIRAPQVMSGVRPARAGPQRVELRQPGAGVAGVERGFRLDQPGFGTASRSRFGDPKLL